MSKSDRSIIVSRTLQKFTVDFPPSPRRVVFADTSLDGDVVLVTGTTGSLGCYLLDGLVNRPDVHRVYALNRPSTQGLKERQSKALDDRGLEGPKILSSEKLVLLAGDLLQPHWGLSAEQFTELQHSVTHIVHNAWPVDFVSPLSAYEPIIQGLRNLIDFAITSPFTTPPHLVFTSSVAVLQNAPYPGAIPEAPVDLKYVMLNGYAEAKWVSEQVLFSAALRTRLNPVVIRVGQICGGQSGAWSTHEWFPIMVQCANELGCFPSDDRCLDWLTFETAAMALIEMRGASSPTSTIHLVNPHHFPWNIISRVVCSELRTDLVPFEIWLERVDAATTAVAQSNARDRRLLRWRKLIPFFRALADMSQSGRMALGLPEAGVEIAIQVSATLANNHLGCLSATDVGRWLSYWKHSGFIVDRVRPML